MKGKNTATVQAYVTSALEQFYQGLAHKQNLSMSKVIAHALTEYAVTQGFDPKKVEKEEMISTIVNDPLLSEAVLIRLLSQIQHKTKVLLAFV